MKIFSQGLFPWSWGRDQRPNRTGEGNHMDKSLLSRRPLSETYCVRNVLDTYGDTPVCEAAYPTRGHRENQVSVSLCWLCSFPHRDVPVGANNIPHRVRFTRALLESKDLSMRFSLPLCVWVSGIGPCSVETASEKRSPRTSYPPGWEAEFAGGGISKLPSARRDSQPACVWKPIFARNGLVSPDRDLQMC